MNTLRSAILRAASIVTLAAALLACGPGAETTCGGAVCSAGMVCVAGRCQVRVDGGGLDGAGDTSVPPDVRPIDVIPVPAGCSADLHDVLDSAGQRIRSCGADEGCYQAQCVAACAAAASSRGNIACDFLVPTPPAYPPALPPCHAVFLANAWTRPVRVTVTRGGMTYDVTAFGRIADSAMPATAWLPVPATGVPEGAVAVLFLSSDPAAILPETGQSQSCPITPAINAGTLVPGSGTGPAWHIAADAPVSAYDIMPYGGAHSHFPSAQVVLPTSVWGTGYVSVNPPPGTHSDPGPQWLQIVALQDNTTVRLRATANLPGGGGAPAAATGVETSTVLAAGQYAQWQLPTGAADPSGTLIATDRPVGVFAGNRFLRLQTVPAPGGESTHQQMLPIDALGSEYVGAPYETRRMDLAPESVPYRLMGVVAGTRLTFDPPIAGAPSTLDRGVVADIVSAEPFVVTSQDAMHPFTFAQLMTSANLPGGSRPGATATGPYGLQLGDEEFVLAFPPAQYLSRYVFFTDPSYPTTNLVLVRERNQSEVFVPIFVDCLGEVSGFRPIGTAGRYEMTTVDLVRTGVGNHGCANGPHSAHSAVPFGLVVWGLDSFSSYAYAAGGNASRLATIDPPL